MRRFWSWQRGPALNAKQKPIEISPHGPRPAVGLRGRAPRQSRVHAAGRPDPGSSDATSVAGLSQPRARAARPRSPAHSAPNQNARGLPSQPVSLWLARSVPPPACGRRPWP